MRQYDETTDTQTINYPIADKTFKHGAETPRRYSGYRIGTRQVAWHYL